MGLRDLAPSVLYGGAAAAPDACAAPLIPAAPAAPALAPAPRRPFLAASAAEGPGIELYSPKFYGVCAVGGALCCGLTHTAVTPLDVVKCNMQINPAKYPGIGAGFRVVAQEAGMSGLVRGWVPTLLGYSVQGAAKFGLYEFFKK